MEVVDIADSLIEVAPYADFLPAYNVYHVPVTNTVDETSVSDHQSATEWEQFLEHDPPSMPQIDQFYARDKL